MTRSTWGRTASCGTKDRASIPPESGRDSGAAQADEHKWPLREAPLPRRCGDRFANGSDEMDMRSELVRGSKLRIGRCKDHRRAIEKVEKAMARMLLGETAEASGCTSIEIPGQMIERDEIKPPLGSRSQCREQHDVDDTCIGPQQIMDRKKILGECGRTRHALSYEIELCPRQVRLGAIPLRRCRECVKRRAICGHRTLERVMCQHMHLVAAAN